MRLDSAVAGRHAPDVPADVVYQVASRGQNWIVTRDEVEQYRHFSRELVLALAREDAYAEHGRRGNAIRIELKDPDGSVHIFRSYPATV